MPLRVLSPTKRHILLALVLAILALALRVPGLDWGLPEVQEEALPMKKALDMWGWNEGHLQLDPHTAGWPSLSFYLHLGTQHIQYAVGRVTGLYHDRFDFLVDNSVDKRSLLLWARALGVLAAAGTVFLASLWGIRLGGSMAAGVLSGLSLALSPLLVKQAQRVTPDILMTFFAAWAIVQILAIHQRGSRRDYLLAGIAIGLGIACKYTPILFAPSLYLVHLQRRRLEGASLRRAGLDDPRLAVAAAAALGAFLLTSPYTLANLTILRRDIAFQALHMRQGHFGQESAAGSGLFFYLKGVLAKGLGWPVLLLGAGGMGWAAWRLRGAWLALVFCTLPFFLGIVALNTRFERYMLPLLMPLTLGLAAWPALWREGKYAGNRRLRRAVMAALTLAVVLPAAVGSWSYLQGAMETDTLSQARQWMIQTLLPHNPALAMETYTPQVPTDRQELLQQEPFFARLSTAQRKRLMDRPTFRADIIPMNSIRVELSDYYYDLRHFLPYDLIVTSSSVRGRYEAQPQRFPRQVEFYRELEKYARLEKTFAPSKKHPGPEIRFYDFDLKGKSRLIRKRGKLPADNYVQYLDRLHGPQFFPFVENVALRAEQARMWKVASHYLDVLLESSLNWGLSLPQRLSLFTRSARTHLFAHEFSLSTQRCEEYQKNGGSSPGILEIQGQALEGLHRDEEALGIYRQLEKQASSKSGWSHWVTWARQRRERIEAKSGKKR